MNKELAKKKAMFKNYTKGESVTTQEYFNFASDKGFAKVSSQVIREVGHLAGPAFLTFCLLVDYANTKTMQCNPSIERMAEHLHKNEKSVRRDIKKLEEIGFIKKIVPTKRKSDGTFLHTNNYIITAHLLVAENAEPVVKEEETKKGLQPQAQEVAATNNPTTNCITEEQEKQSNKRPKPKLIKKKDVVQFDRVASTEEEAMVQARKLITELNKATKATELSREDKEAVKQNALEDGDMDFSLRKSSSEQRLEQCKKIVADSKNNNKVEEVFTRLAYVAHKFNILDKYPLLTDYAYEKSMTEKGECKVYFSDKRQVFEDGTTCFIKENGQAEMHNINGSIDYMYNGTVWKTLSKEEAGDANKAVRTA